MYKTMNPEAQWSGEHLSIKEAQITHSPINDMLNIKLLCSWNIRFQIMYKQQ